MCTEEEAGWLLLWVKETRWSGWDEPTLASSELLVISQQKLLDKWLTWWAFFKKHQQVLCHILTLTSFKILELAKGFMQVNTYRPQKNTEFLSCFLQFSIFIYWLNSVITKYCIQPSFFGPHLFQLPQTKTLHFTGPLEATEHSNSCFLISLLYLIMHDHAPVLWKIIWKKEVPCQCQNPAASIRRTVTANFSIANSCFCALLHGSHKSTL